MIRPSMLLALLLVVLSAACTPVPRVREEPEPVLLPQKAPEDFALGITVLGPGDVAIDTLPRPQRPARYIVEPDGILRAALGPGATPRVFPGQTRRLTDSQIDRLWRLLAATGLYETDTLTRIDNTETFFPSRDRTTALLYVRQRDRVDHFAVRLPVGDAESASVLQMIDEVAALAWIPE